MALFAFYQVLKRKPAGPICHVLAHLRRKLRGLHGTALEKLKTLHGLSHVDIQCF